MLRASVPPAPHDLNGHARTREDDVGSYRSVAVEHDRIVDAEAEAARVEQLADSDLGFRVAAAVSAHVGATF
jgi:hypothetical protein